MNAKRPLIATILAWSLAACGYRDVAPPAAPDRVIPRVAERSTPPAEGRTRVTLDANGERATVTEVNAWSPGPARSPAVAPLQGGANSGLERPVCMTPCVSDFEVGLHVLRFSSMTDDRSSVAQVQIDEQGEKAIRHAMGRTDQKVSPTRVTGWVLTSVGAAILTAAGLVLLPHAGEKGNEAQSALEKGLVVTSVGVVTLGTGVTLMILGQPVHQEGSTTEISSGH